MASHKDGSRIFRLSPLLSSTHNPSHPPHNPEVLERLVFLALQTLPETSCRPVDQEIVWLMKHNQLVVTHHSKSGVYRGIQSTLVISNSKGLSEILRDIRTSTYQICRTEEKIIRLTTFNKFMCNWTHEVRDILKIL